MAINHTSSTGRSTYNQGLFSLYTWWSQVFETPNMPTQVQGVSYDPTLALLWFYQFRLRHCKGGGGWGDPGGGGGAGGGRYLSAPQNHNQFKIIVSFLEKKMYLK